MSTARELLDQADALIRQNRLRASAATDAATDIPVLTEVVAVGDVPVLTEVVEDFEPTSIMGESGAAEAAAEVSATPEAAAAVAGDSDDARWSMLAEVVRMQVLQRIDIFTDTALQEQLTARLQPIVDRASADLVATINRQVGELLRECVAEAIEREIGKWRRGDAS